MLSRRARKEILKFLSFPETLTYEHPNGTVVWVKLDHVSVFKDVNNKV